MILDEIVDNRYRELKEAKRLLSLEEIKAQVLDLPPPRNFGAAIVGPKVRVIAEIKRASPSMGEIDDPLFDPRLIAQTYSGNGAAALSVLTERKYFGGEPHYIKRARKYMPLPILRKDFIIDPYQIYESRMLLADAVLLIVRILEDDELEQLLGLTHRLGLAALVEAHSEAEIKRALNVGAKIIGINNRDLDTLTVDLATTERLRRLVPPEVTVVSESGLHSRADVERLAACDIHAVLVGASLMKAADPGAILRPMSDVYRPGFESFE